MKLIKQNSPTTCGQACVAMVKGISLEESIELFGHSNTTSDYEILKALGLTFIQSVENGKDTYSKVVFGKPQRNIIAIVKHTEKSGIRSHWTVWNYGETFDPACIKGKLWPITKYIEVTC